MKYVVLTGILLAPAVALAAPRNFGELVDLGIIYINAGIGVALILGIVVYFWGVTAHVKDAMEGKTSDFRTQILWGIIALFVMFSVWGILTLLRNTLFGSGGYQLGGGGTAENCASIEDCAIGQQGQR